MVAFRRSEPAGSSPEDTGETASAGATTYGPWNPGIRSRLPGAFLPLATIYRPENVSSSLAETLERSSFTGLEPEDLVVFRPERLAIHELLVRVTGDIWIPDGHRYADLGINFREAVECLRSRYIQPHMPELLASFNDLKQCLERMIDAELERTLFAADHPPAAKKAGFFFWRQRAEPAGRPVEPPGQRQRRCIEAWRDEASSTSDPLRRRLCRTLARLVTAIAVKQGDVWIDRGTLCDLAGDLLANEHGSIVLGEMIAPFIREGAVEQGYRLLPAQADPVVMNVKGASAAGKSTMRPLQHELASRLGIDWSDFALISPDIWRKYLLDYESLGEAYRYAGTLTGHELKIVDQKLDRYMAEKARAGRTPHLLIDRFRFDSFAEEDGREGARLLSRFGSTVYMFFVITPPHATVERAWIRGLEFGRFKAVDDLLDHNVEAFTGMPRLFFAWAARKDKRVHFEFIDNGVPKDERPWTVAFGWNDEMTILDMKQMLDIDRYKAINIQARDAQSVYPETDAMRPELHTAFLRQCARRIRKIDFASQACGRIYATMKNGRFVWIDPSALAAALDDPEIRAGLMALDPRIEEQATGPEIEARFVDQACSSTLGRWGPATPRGSGACG